MNTWLTRYTEPKVGDSFKLRKDTDKTGWAIEPDYISTYSITKIEGNEIILENEGGHSWIVGEGFLKIHFNKVL